MRYVLSYKFLFSGLSGVGIEKGRSKASGNAKKRAELAAELGVRARSCDRFPEGRPAGDETGRIEQD